jgi:hypothetical protein
MFLYYLAKLFIGLVVIHVGAQFLQWAGLLQPAKAK